MEPEVTASNCPRSWRCGGRPPPRLHRGRTPQLAAGVSRRASSIHLDGSRHDQRNLRCRFNAIFCQNSDNTSTVVLRVSARHSIPSGDRMRSTVVGGAMLPHAPQFFTMPDTEDKKSSSRYARWPPTSATSCEALNPDLWIIFSNDHAEQFFHNAAPPFTVHVGGEASGEFAGRKFHWEDPQRDWLRDRAPAVSAEFRSGIQQHCPYRLRDWHSADAYRPHRSGAADLRQCVSAAAADHGALLFFRPGHRAHGNLART